jgi:hypothetical protein
MHLFGALTSVGFGRSSFRHFFQWIRMQLKGLHPVRLGSKVRDCRLVSVADVGTRHQSLLEHMKESRNNILVLVMGSYT